MGERLLSRPPPCNVQTWHIFALPAPTTLSPKSSRDMELAHEGLWKRVDVGPENSKRCQVINDVDDDDDDAVVFYFEFILISLSTIRWARCISSCNSITNSDTFHDRHSMASARESTWAFSCSYGIISFCIHSFACTNTMPVCVLKRKTEKYYEFQNDKVCF